MVRMCSHTRGAVQAMQATWEAQFDQTPYEILGASSHPFGGGP